MKNTKPARKKLTLDAQTVRQLSADQLEHAIGGAASDTCTNNSCQNMICRTF